MVICFFFFFFLSHEHRAVAVGFGIGCVMFQDEEWFGERFSILSMAGGVYLTLDENAEMTY